MEGRRVFITLCHPSSQVCNCYGTHLLGFSFSFLSIYCPSLSLIESLSWQEHFEKDRGALFPWPTEGGEVEAPSPSAAGGCCTDVITTLPWAQSTYSTGESTRSTSNPSSPTRAYRRSRANGGFHSPTGVQETDRPQPLFWRSRWEQHCCCGCVLMDARLNSLNMTNNPAFEYEDNVHEFVGMVDTNNQPEGLVHSSSSSQADYEGSVSLRVNPTYAQGTQEDPEFSNLLSRYSPEDIITMLSKHTSLEGEALRLFTSLPASDLINFDIVSE
ncbi:hypothetical protein Taro_013844 [Colocasia esculenta]|uniref:Uncharacterized protein n=1 Tax=Colocasia esculenta TaxID=4460 RepID=A0A843UHA1_COLES|nr:hypothetical protein [Colocasia esculenta]